MKNVRIPKIRIFLQIKSNNSIIPLTFKYKFSIMTSVSNFAEVSPNGRAAAWKAVGG